MSTGWSLFILFLECEEQVEMVISFRRSVLYQWWPSGCVMLGYACPHGPSHLAQNALHIWMKACLCFSMCKFCCAINKALIQDSMCQWVGVLTLESGKFGFNSINGHSGMATHYWEAIFFYRVHVDNLILPSQGDWKNSEFDNSQVCNRHNADVQ